MGDRRPSTHPPITTEFLKALPKTDLHLHLDGSVRLTTLIELAEQEGIELPANTVEGLKEKVFKEHYESRLVPPLTLGRYIEVRFAPQLHFNDKMDIPQIVHAVNNGLKRAKDEFNDCDGVKEGSEPEFNYGIICTAMRMFAPVFSEYYRDLSRCHQFAPDKTLQSLASIELARAAVHLRDIDGLPIVGFDLAGSENGFPPKIHNEAFDYVTKNFMNRTVHAGEAFGPESIVQAIVGCSAQRIGHGYHLFSTENVTNKDIKDADKFVHDLVQVHMRARRNPLQMVTKTSSLSV
ncbi:hypothetical protein SARC_10236 [Sphaeroforma arctica JP610]|uniref:adenosine deaminase n=1 Tax=Sphaeroforma arctica JP610 TaxID=667725 RepID=A0A0L0FKJ7_9EUKA|nr:hypothetical protein SARC_10236 [Sphaeroforma arctica JP610]KNC77302.1 hypothetical protein SARC_10236 [Sphaeroforma arctica JP610]|eukprot:XP_014151204.1 hypothetical protein SARC_10236 [Sphaeroforma arctica JP610]